MAGRRDLIIVPSLSRRPEINYVPLIEERQSLYRTHKSVVRCPRARRTIAAITTPDRRRGYLHSQDLKRLGHRQAHATVEMMEAQLILILTGRFIGYLPAQYAQAWVKSGELRCLGEYVYSYDSTFYAVGQRRTAESPLSRRFLSFLVAAAKGKREVARNSIRAESEARRCLSSNSWVTTATSGR